MGWWKKGRRDTDPVAPGAGDDFIDDDLINLTAPYSFYLTEAGWSCAEAAMDGYTERGVILEVTGMPIGTSDTSTYRFFVGEHNIGAFTLVAVEMANHVAAHRLKGDY